MSMTPQDRSKQLHNFSLPCLKWGNQRVLRCVKLLTDQDTTTNEPQQFHDRNGSSSSLLINNHHHHLPPPPPPPPPPLPTPPDDRTRPWNLRTRRSVLKTPLRIEDRDNNINNPVRTNNNEGLFVKRHSCYEIIKDDKKKKKIKFSVSLTKSEIEEDFFNMARIRPPRRPKKRPRIVQKYLDSNFPGLWLTEVTLDSYKVPEVPEQ